MRSHVSLFSGIGSCSLASAQLGYTAVACVEQDEFCQGILRLRQPQAAIFGDVRTVGVAELGTDIDLMSGGSPCQDLSSAGKGAGLAGERSGLWFEYLRIIGECRPRMVLLENVAVLRTRGLDTVVRGLAEHGYGCWWDCAPALSVGAPHMRDRIWLVAVPVEDMPLLANGRLLRPSEPMPRAGACFGGGVFVHQPRATQRMAKDAMGAVKLADGTTWLTAIASPLFPTATRRDWKSGAASDATHARNSQPLNEYVARHPEAGLPLFPTATVGDSRNSRNSTANRTPGGNHHAGTTLSDYMRLWPTPRSSANEWRTTRAAPSHGAGHGRVLPGEVCAAERSAGREVPPGSGSAGPLNPAWVEWLMGLPIGHTDPACAEPVQLDWLSEHSIPRVLPNVPHRKQRLMACGNTTVWRVAYEQLRHAHELLGR